MMCEACPAKSSFGGYERAKMAKKSDVAPQLNESFLQFAGYGTRQPETQMDGKNFSKLCKDCNLLDKKFTAIDADITFSKVSTPSA